MEIELKIRIKTVVTIIRKMKGRQHFIHVFIVSTVSTITYSLRLVLYQ